MKNVKYIISENLEKNMSILSKYNIEKVKGISYIENEYKNLLVSIDMHGIFQCEVLDTYHQINRQLKTNINDNSS